LYVLFVFFSTKEILSAFRFKTDIVFAESSLITTKTFTGVSPGTSSVFSLEATTRRPGAVYTHQVRSPAGDEVTDRRILPTARGMELVGASSRACIRMHARALARASCRVYTDRYTRVLPRVSADSPCSRIPMSWHRQRRLRRLRGRGGGRGGTSHASRVKGESRGGGGWGDDGSGGDDLSATFHYRICRWSSVMPVERVCSSMIVLANDEACTLKRGRIAASEVEVVEEEERILTNNPTASTYGCSVHDDPLPLVPVTSLTFRNAKQNSSPFWSPKKIPYDLWHAQVCSDLMNNWRFSCLFFGHFLL